MKIGFLAMSGIRAHDPELLELGLTLPGFVERSKVIASLPSLGLLTLAGLTPDKHDLRYLDIPDVDAPDILSALPGPLSHPRASASRLYSPRLSSCHPAQRRPQ